MIFDKLVDKYLDKNGFIKVPKSWSEDYRDLVNKTRETNKALREIAREYNNLLREFANEKSIAWLKEALTELKLDAKGLNKEELIDRYVEAYAVNFEDDTDEEVK